MEMIAGQTQFASMSPCDSCYGARVKIEDPCATCDSKGFTMTQENVKFTIKEDEET